MEMKEEDFRPSMAAVWGATFAAEFYRLLSVAADPADKDARERAAGVAAMRADITVKQAAKAWDRRGED